MNTVYTIPVRKEMKFQKNKDADFTLNPISKEYIK